MQAPSVKVYNLAADRQAGQLKTLRVIGGVLAGIIGGGVVWYIAGFIVVRLLERVLYPGFTGTLELSASNGPRLVFELLFVLIWLGGIVVSCWWCVHYLNARARKRALHDGSGGDQVQAGL